MSDAGSIKPDCLHYHLRLFVAGNSPLSIRTIATLHRICAAHLLKPFDLEIVDIYQQPHLANEDQVVAAPTLVKLSPPPIRRIIGDLSDKPRVLRALGLASPEGDADEL